MDNVIKNASKGYFEDKNGNKYYRQDEMKTKNIYSTASAKMTKNVKPKLKRKKPTHARQVIVDGILYESVRKAEQVCGFKYDVLRQALRAGQNMSNGHTIAYADETPVEMPRIIDYKPEKETKISIIVNSDDPAIEAINDKIVSILKKAGVYEEIEKLSKAIQKLSK